MPRLIIRLAVAALGEKRVAKYIAERYDTQGYCDIIRAVARLCSVLNIPYTAGKRETPEAYAEEIRGNIDVCIGMAICRNAKARDTASLRDPYNNAPHTCKHNLDHGEKTDPNSAQG